MHEAWWLVDCCPSSPLSQYAKAVLSPWKDRDSKERTVVRELKEKKECERQAEVLKEVPKERDL